jgi:hypothetical protein
MHEEKGGGNGVELKLLILTDNNIFVTVDDLSRLRTPSSLIIIIAVDHKLKIRWRQK